MLLRCSVSNPSSSQRFTIQLSPFSWIASEYRVKVSSNSRFAKNSGSVQTWNCTLRFNLPANFWCRMICIVASSYRLSFRFDGLVILAVFIQKNFAESNLKPKCWRKSGSMSYSSTNSMKEILGLKFGISFTVAKLLRIK